MTRAPEAVSRAHLPALDGIRGLAILLVLVHNLSIHQANDSLVEKLWTLVVESGWIGVQLFFVLSGFLITGILIDDRGKPRYLRTFYLRRFLRILPLYYVFLVGRLMILPLIVPAAHVPANEAIWYWLYLSNWSQLAMGVAGMGHFWSLAVEEQFYVAWPWVVGATRDRTLAWICIGLVVASPVARVVCLACDMPPMMVYASTIGRLDALALGALAALALRSPTWRPRIERVIRPALAISAIGMLVIMAATHGLNRDDQIVQVAGYSVIAIGSAAIVIAAATGGWIARFGVHPMLRMFGRYSYGIYVLQFAIKLPLVYYAGDALFAARARAPVPVDLAVIVLGIALTTGAAMLSWVLLEKRVLTLKDRFAPRAPDRPRN